MNKSSLLRTYALLVCVLTGVSVTLIAGIPLWQGLVRAAQAIEQNEVYQFYHEHSSTAGCNDCREGRALTAAPTKPRAISTYQPHVAPEQSLADSSEQSSMIPPAVFMALRIMIGLVGVVIFFVHWRLYRNLAHAQ
jgi:hypothetical protein